MDEGEALLNPPRLVSSRRPSLAGGAWWGSAAIALGTGLAAFAVGNVAESVIIRAVHGNRSDLEWLSDTVISMAVAGITYLWLHLRASRLRVLALEREQIAIDEQLRLAAEIQRSLLPEVPPATPGFRWAARMLPAGRIGGDFYDFLALADGTVLAILGDVSGKGIAAALILSALRTLFRTIARETTDPAALTRRISAALYDEYAGLPYVTAIVVRFERSRRMSYVNAGHPAGLLLRDGAVRAALESGGPPLGLLPEATYTRTDFELHSGDLGVLVTDGVTEALEGGPIDLSQVLGATHRARQSPSDVCEALLRAADAGPGPEGAPGWQDDRTVLVFAVDANA